MEYKSTPTLVLAVHQAGSGCLLLLEAMGAAGDLAGSSGGQSVRRVIFSSFPRKGVISSVWRREWTLLTPGSLRFHSLCSACAEPAQPSPCPQVGTETFCISTTFQVLSSWGCVRAGLRQQLGNSSLPQGQGFSVPQNSLGKEWDGACSGFP